jgi:hypothetical protein
MGATVEEKIFIDFVGEDKEIETARQFCNAF